MSEKQKYVIMVALACVGIVAIGGSLAALAVRGSSGNKSSVPTSSYNSSTSSSSTTPASSSNASSSSFSSSSSSAEAVLTAIQILQASARAGLASTNYELGNNFLAREGYTASYDYFIADFDHYGLKNTSLTHSVTLVNTTADGGYGYKYSAPELSFAVTKKTLPAGKYSISVENITTYVFTTTKDIPIGGGILYDTSSHDVTTYDATRIESEPMEECGTATVYDSDADADAYYLGTLSSLNIEPSEYENEYGRININARDSAGNNNWAVSIIRQWLNADLPAGEWWEPKTIFQLKPSWADTTNGYLYGLDDDFKNALAETVVTYYLPIGEYYFMEAGEGTLPPDWDLDDGTTVSNRTVTTYDKVFLLSYNEVGGSSSYDTAAGNTVLEYFSGASNADRIAYCGGHAFSYWLRSPDPEDAITQYCVNPGGSFSAPTPISSIAVRPAVNIA